MLKYGHRWDTDAAGGWRDGRIGVPPVLLPATENWRMPGSAALTDWAARHRTAILS